MRVIITGSAGFIGFHLSRKLLREGFDVYGIDNLNDYYSRTLKSNRLKQLQNKNFHFFEDDIANLSKIKNQYDIAINLAAQAGIRVGKELEENYFKSNISGFKSFCDFCIKNKVKKMIYASSSSVYADSKKEAFSEERTQLNPKSLYGLTKLFNEKYSELIFRKYSLNIVGLRFFSVYGPYGRPDMAYYSFADAISRNKTITLNNQGKMARDMTYIDDIVDGIFKSIEYISNNTTTIQHEIFNLGNDKPILTSYLLESIEKTLQTKAKIKHSQTLNESSYTHADLCKARRIIGYNPQIKFDDGIAEFLKWYLKYERHF